MKLQWNILRRLSGNNRGSGIVVVLVSMTAPVRRVLPPMPLDGHIKPFC